MLLTDVFICMQVGAAEVGTAGTGATGERETGTGTAGKRETGKRKTGCCRSGNTWAGQHKCISITTMQSSLSSLSLFLCLKMTMCLPYILLSCVPTFPQSFLAVFETRMFFKVLISFIWSPVANSWFDTSQCMRKGVACRTKCGVNTT